MDSKTAKWKSDLAFERIENWLLLKCAAQVLLFKRWVPMAESLQEGKKSGVLLLRAGCLCFTYVLFRIDLGTCWLILFCKRWEVLPTYQLSQRQTYLYTTLLGWNVGKKSLCATGQILFVVWTIFGWNDP